MTSQSSATIQLKTFLGYYYYYFFHHQPSTFTICGQKYSYLHHKYNATWRTERAVEVPIIWDWITRFQGAKILEVGNVLSHYGMIQHSVVDKYEVAPGVINQDIVDFQPNQQYDLIVSISTLEHVGFDETPRDDEKILRAFEHLHKLLADKGVLVVTLPIGYNPNLDGLLATSKVPFTQQICLKRITKSNKWREATWAEIQNTQYDAPFPSANGLLVGVLEK